VASALAATVKATVPLPTPVDAVDSHAADDTACQASVDGDTVRLNCSLPPSAPSADAARASVTVGSTTAKLCVTAAAACHCASPGCVACTVQVPAASSLAVAPITVHTDGVWLVSVTASPDVVVAVRGTEPTESACVATAANVSVCRPGCTVSVWLPPVRPLAAVSDWPSSHTSVSVCAPACPLA
jgi:hypothetical protein